MCSILAWAGNLPKGLLSSLLLQGSSRGQDSTGLAFYGSFDSELKVDGKTVSSKVRAHASYRRALSPREYVRRHASVVGLARRSPVGIGHTRRASTGMPVDDDNAHPFQYWDFYFAHNGKIENWVEVKEILVGHFHDIAAKHVSDALSASGYTGEAVESIVNFVKEHNQVPVTVLEGQQAEFSAQKEACQANGMPMLVKVVKHKPDGHMVAKGDVYARGEDLYQALQQHRSLTSESLQGHLDRVESVKQAGHEVPEEDELAEVNWPPSQNSLYWHRWFGVSPVHLSLFPNYRLLYRTLQCQVYSESITTDSQVLGPFINSRDFSLVEGCMALVWMRNKEVYALRHNKEAVAAKITWSQSKKSSSQEDDDEDSAEAGKTYILTLVASTREIIHKAVDKLDESFTVDIEFVPFEEGKIYKLRLDGLEDCGKVPLHNRLVVDPLSSMETK